MNSLKLNSIKLYNFKSFLGEHTIDCLNQHLNIITGPNGSGKSNILDALLFVLGFKAKKLRHTSQADLIHYDSKDGVCFVELVFSVYENFDINLTNSQENLTNKNLTKSKQIYAIKRELKSKNKTIKNTYYLNNQEIKLPELTLFFKKYLDLENNRFLILQGEIESISLMKPKKTASNSGMLEYLEEVIGTSEFNSEIDSLTEEIDKMKSDNERKASTFKFYQKELKYLEERKEKEEVNEYLSQLETQSKVSKLTILRNELEIKESKEIIQQLKSESTNQKNEILITEEKKRKEEKKVNSLQKNLKEKEEIFLQMNKEKKKKEELINKRNKKEIKVNELKKEINELEKKESEVKEEIKEIDNKIKKNEKVIKEIKEEINKINKQSKINKINKNKLSELESKRNELNNKINEISLIIKSKETLLNKLEIEENNSKNKMTDNILINKNEENNKRINELEKDLELTLNELTKQRINLKESLSYQNNNKIDLALKNIPGVLGRLSDLGSVDEKYEVAVSAAGKGALNFIVVNDSSVAEKCAEKVKQMKSKVTFIILDKIQEVPNFSSDNLLINLIKCDEKLKKCFYFAVKDTHLAYDIEEGKKLAYGKERKRVVTLDGKLIEKSGLMCKSVIKKGNLFNKSKKYEKNVSELERVIEKIKEEINLLIKESKPKEKNILKNISLNIEEIKKEIKNNQSLKNKLKNELINIEREIEEINKNKIGEEYTKLIDLENKEEELEGINQSLRIKREEIKIQDYSNKRKELSKLTNELLSMNIDSFTSEEEREIIEREYKEISQEYESVNKKYLEIKDYFDKLYYQGLDIKNKLENKSNLINNLEEKNIKIKEEERKRVKEINKITSIITINNNKINKNIMNNYININKDDNINSNNINMNDNINDIDNINNNINDINDMNNDNINDLNDVKSIDNLIKKESKKLRKTEVKQIDLELIEEFYKKNNEFIKIKEDYLNYLALLQEKNKELNLLLEKRHSLFTQGLSEINTNLKDVYQTITFGGNAELELVDSLDPFSEGILFSVMPPKKVWRNIKNLSGGERTLASLSLVFALHLYKPSPFYVMDEIDAALDFKNVSIIANFIRERTKDSQFIIISLRNDMFEIGSTFVGVYKNDNRSEVFLINE